MRTRAKTPEGVLRAAARYIEEHGHIKGKMMGSNGAVCLHGAIQAVVVGSPVGPIHDAALLDLVNKAGRAADDRVAELYPAYRDEYDTSTADSLVFSDDPETTKDMVLAVLRG